MIPIRREPGKPLISDYDLKCPCCKDIMPPRNGAFSEYENYKCKCGANLQLMKYEMTEDLCFVGFSTIN